MCAVVEVESTRTVLVSGELASIDSPRYRTSNDVPCRRRLTFTSTSIFLRSFSEDYVGGQWIVHVEDVLRAPP